MNLVFYNKNALNDIAIVVLRFGTTKVKIKKDNFIFLFSEDNSLIGLNILNASKTLHNLKSVFTITNEIKDIISKFDYKIDYSPTLIITKVINIKKHYESNNLYIVNVTDDKTNYNVVTNLSDIQIGQKMVLSKNYSILPNGDFILPKKIVGVKSDGMFCQAKTLMFDENKIKFQKFVNSLNIGSEFKI